MLILVQSFAEANTTSLKALCHLGVVPTRSAKAASILTGYSNKDALEQRKQVKSFASTDTGFSDEDAATYSGLEPFPQPNFSREPRPLKTSQASSFSQPVSAAGPARHLRTMSINSAKATQSLNGPSKPSSQTLACAYIVGGLPKQPSHWTVAEHDAPPARMPYLPTPRP